MVSIFGYIYKTTNLKNGKIYIGQHKKTFYDSSYYGSGTWFKRVLEKEGLKNFKNEMIDTCDDLDSLNQREIYWIEYYNSTNPAIGYNLAKGGDQALSGCSEKDIALISSKLLNSTQDNIYDIINELIPFGLRIYEAGEGWKPTSYNSKLESAMVAKDNSIIVSFYTRKQLGITKRYSKEYDCSYWKYNLMLEIDKIPKFIRQVKQEYDNQIIIPEDQWGVGAGTSGVFLETQKIGRKKSIRMAIVFS